MKKGQSTVISSILLILMVIVIAAIIVVFATGFLSQKQSEQKFSISTKNLNIDLRDFYFEPDPPEDVGGSGGPPVEAAPPFPKGEIDVILTRIDSDEEIPKSGIIRFIFHLTSGKTVSLDSGPIPDIGYNKQYIISSDDLNNNGILLASEIEKIEIQAVFEDGATQTLDYISEINWDSKAFPSIPSSP